MGRSGTFRFLPYCGRCTELHHRFDRILLRGFLSGYGGQGRKDHGDLGGSGKCVSPACVRATQGGNSVGCCCHLGAMRQEYSVQRMVCKLTCEAVLGRAVHVCLVETPAPVRHIALTFRRLGVCVRFTAGRKNMTVIGAVKKSKMVRSSCLRTLCATFTIQICAEIVRALPTRVAHRSGDCV